MFLRKCKTSPCRSFIDTIFVEKETFTKRFGPVHYNLSMHRMYVLFFFTFFWKEFNEKFWSNKTTGSCCKCGMCVFLSSHVNLFFSQKLKSLSNFCCKLSKTLFWGLEKAQTGVPKKTGGTFYDKNNNIFPLPPHIHTQK